jgi:hypothetical protein
MFLTETANFAVSTASFLHSVFKAVVNYATSWSDEVKPMTCVKSVAAAASSQTAPASTSPTADVELPSVVDIKRELPKSCFQSHVSTSMYYFGKDILQVLAS